MARCIPYVLEEGTAGDQDQAIAYCSDIWEREKEKAMDRKTKTFRGQVELKDDGEEGTFRSVFATLNVIDHDKDVTPPGAFMEGQDVVVEGWNHDYGLPPGKGVIHSDDKEAWIDGRFFLETDQGRNHYNTLKALGGLEQWSYTFRIEEGQAGQFDGEDVYFLNALDVWGVAPVTRGAGLGTRTVALKSGGLTEDELAGVRALLKEREKADGNTEGQAGADDQPGGEPSGVPDDDVVLRLEIMRLQAEEV
jgi:phage head maturation protease